MLRPPPFPISIDQLGPEVLTDALGARVASFRATRIGADRGMLGEIHRLDVVYEPGEAGPSAIIAKLAALREGSLDSARRGGTHERELRCYTELLGSTPIRAPAVHAAWYDPSTAHFLLLQDVVDADLGVDQIGGLDADRATLVLGEVARLHARWLGDPTLAELGWLPRLDAEQRRSNLTALAAAGWEPLCELLGDELTAAERGLGAELPDRLVAMLDEVAQLPSTLIHGDLRTDNLLFTPDGSEVWLVDWQGAGIGPVGFDLAYFLSQCLTVDARRANQGALLASYRSALAGAGVELEPEEIMAGFGPSLLFGLAIACALPLISDPGEPRVRRLAATVTRRTIEALRDNGQLWIDEPASRGAETTP